MKKIFTLAAIAATLISCSDNEVCQEEPQPKDEILIYSTIADVTQTKVGYDATAKASWIDGDAIGLFCAESIQPGVNTQFSVLTAAWTPTTPIYWKDATTLHKFVAYAPYVSGNINPDAVKLPNIGTQLGTLNPAFDFLISNNHSSTGIARAAAPVDLVFTHALSLIEFKVIAGNGILANSTLPSFTLAGAPTVDKLFTTDGNSTIKLLDGTVALNAAVTNTITVTPTSPIALSGTATSVYVFLLPGDYTAPTLTLKLNDGGATPAIDITGVSIGTTLFEKAKKYTYTVTISRTAIAISNPIITDWITVPGTPITPGI